MLVEIMLIGLNERDINLDNIFDGMVFVISKCFLKQLIFIKLICIPKFQYLACRMLPKLMTYKVSVEANI